MDVYITYMKKRFILSRQLNTHTDTHTQKWLPFVHSPPVPMGLCLPPLSLLWLTGSQGARWTEWWFSWRALPACFQLGVKQITLCMHEYITSAAVIILGKAKAFGTCALLPTWLMCTCCHCCTIKVSLNVCCEDFYLDKMLLQLQMFFTGVQGRETYIMKHSQNWNWLCTTLKLSFYEYSSEPQTALQLQ